MISSDYNSTVIRTFIYPTLSIRKYGTVVFIATNKLETSKRKLQYLTFRDFYSCAQGMMANWTTPLALNDETTADADVEREFLMDLRELRVLLDKEKEHKT